MDKVKSLLSPGHESDDAKLYGQGTAPADVTGSSSTDMPGGFTETPGEGPTTNPISNAPGAANSADTGAIVGSTHPTGTASSTTGPSGGYAAPHVAHGGDADSTASIKSGVLGNTTTNVGTVPATIPATGTARDVNSGAGAIDSRAELKSGSALNSQGTLASSSTLPDPPFSNRQNHPAGSGTHVGGAGGAAWDSSTPGHRVTSGTPIAPDPYASERSGEGVAIIPAATAVGHVDQESMRRHEPGNLTENPVEGPIYNRTDASADHGVGSFASSSQLPDRSRVPSDGSSAIVAPTTTERSFPLGGHVGEGFHPTATANRLDTGVATSGVASGADGGVGTGSAKEAPNFSSRNLMTGHHAGRDAAIGGVAGSSTHGLDAREPGIGGSEPVHRFVRTEPQEDSNAHASHMSREATSAGGSGASGAIAAAHGKDSTDQGHEDRQRERSSSSAKPTIIDKMFSRDPEKKAAEREAKKEQKEHEKELKKEEKEAKKQEKSHGHGKDTAGMEAGGAGGAAAHEVGQQGQHPQAQTGSYNTAAVSSQPGTMPGTAVTGEPQGQSSTNQSNYTQTGAAAPGGFSAGASEDAGPTKKGSSEAETEVSGAEHKKHSGLSGLLSSSENAKKLHKDPPA